MLANRAWTDVGASEEAIFIHETDILAARFNLSDDVRTRAEAIYRRAIRLGSDRPTSILAAASIYIGCRQGQVPITLRDLAAAAGVDFRRVGKCYLSLVERMDISRPTLNGNSYLDRLALKLQVPAEALGLSRELICRASQKGLEGRNPMTLAAAALYASCCSTGVNVTQAELAEVAGVTEISIRECWRAVRTLRSNQHSP